MAESVVSGVAARLGELLIQEANFLSGVNHQVQKLQTELNWMQGFLKNENTMEREWVVEIRDLAYDAEDIIETYVFKVASRRGGGIQKVLMRCACILDEGTTVHKLGSEIAEIKTTISDFTARLQTYGIIRQSIEGDRRLSSVNDSQQQQRQTFPHVKPAHVVGLDENISELVACLTTNKEKRVVSICGMPGVGKTTLAKMVYHHPEVKNHFDCLAWAYISQQCQRRQVWEGILISLVSLSDERREQIQKMPDAALANERREQIQKMPDAALANELYQVQKQKKCLVVLDDIWTFQAWRDLHAAFPITEDTQSMIMLTSRNRDVALHVAPQGFLHVPTCLNEERSWELLKKVAISWREDSKINSNLENLGREMVKCCGGLPLAITLLGGLLATRRTEGEWEEVFRHVKSYLHEEDNSRLTMVMGLSYDDLPFQLKPCFLYLAHFPEDFEISTKELIRMWMGEGFLPKFQHGGGREDTMEDVGERYLRELVQRCMVLVGEFGSLGRIKTCRIHDLMREFCVSKAQGENFLQITNIHSMEVSEAHIDKIRRLAINWDRDDFSAKRDRDDFDPMLPLMISKKYPYVRSLLYFSYSVRNNVVKSMFKSFRSLRVLNLGNAKPYKKELPKDIGCLIHLRFLSLKDSYVNNVPSSMGNLRCLQTLDLRYSLDVNVRVPNVFKKMEQLRHLYLPRFYKVYEKLEVGNLCYLQTLVNVWPKKIRLPTSFTFNRLWVLKVETLSFATNPDMLRSYFELGRDIIEKLNVRSYFEGSPNIIQILSSCPHLYKLDLRSIKKLPEVHQFSSNLAKLTLEWNLFEEDPMATLEKLPNLKILRLLWAAFFGKNMVCSERGFPQLQSLVLEYLGNLEEWRVEEGAMPSLCRLQIQDCYNLKTIPDGLRFVTTLQELEIKNMSKTFKDRVDKGGEDFCKVQHVPSLVFQDCDRDW